MEIEWIDVEVDAAARGFGCRPKSHELLRELLCACRVNWEARPGKIQSKYNVRIDRHWLRLSIAGAVLEMPKLVLFEQSYNLCHATMTMRSMKFVSDPVVAAFDGFQHGTVLRVGLRRC